MSNKYISGLPPVGSTGGYVPFIHKEMRDPTIYDYQNYFLFDLWLNELTDNVFILVSLARPSAGPGSQATWVSITASGGTGGIGSWVDVTGASQMMVDNTGYTANNAGLVTLTLPVTAIYGTVQRVVGKGAGGWLIAQPAGVQIHYGNQSTTIGVAGSIASTQQYDAIELLCTVANSKWTVINGPQGNLTVI